MYSAAPKDMIEGLTKVTEEGVRRFSEEKLDDYPLAQALLRWMLYDLHLANKPISLLMAGHDIFPSRYQSLLVRGGNENPEYPYSLKLEVQTTPTYTPRRVVDDEGLTRAISSLGAFKIPLGEFTEDFHNPKPLIEIATIEDKDLKTGKKQGKVWIEIPRTSIDSARIWRSQILGNFVNYYDYVVREAGFGEKMIEARARDLGYRE